MDPLRPPLYYKENSLTIDGTNIVDLAERFGTPLYVYSAQTIRDAIDEFRRGGDGQSSLFCFAMKSNSNRAILEIMNGEGMGADIVSGGELFRALGAGIPAGRIIYSGVGKTDEEMRMALHAGILLFSVESEQELHTLSQIARSEGISARISIRVNPDIDAGTHPYISTGLRENKFGIMHDQALRLYGVAKGLPSVEPVGIGFHIGSQITGLAAFREAGQLITNLAAEVERIGVKLRYVDVGGGLGITYSDESPPGRGEYVQAMAQAIRRPDLTLIFEPGRSIIGSAGILITRILFIKESGSKRFYICDAAMNDLMRPTLYQAYHAVHAIDPATPEGPIADLVGPICETGDFIARDRGLPEWKRGDLAVIATAGAYGFSMSSNYNSRPRAAEVLMDREGFRLIRRRESYEDIVRLEEIDRQ
jgi:diaminopimelate decarboxylase